MIGMILCGGYGKRLVSHTKEEDIPKTLIEIKDDYTILDNKLFKFKHAGIDKAILLTGHLGEKIEKRYGKDWDGLKIVYTREKEPLGTLGAIKLGIKKAKNEDVVVSNGDVISDINLKKMVQKAKDSKYLVTLFLTRMQSPYGVVETTEEKVKSFIEKPMLDYYINAGTYYIKNEAFKYFDEYEKGDIEKILFPQLAKDDKIGFYKEDAFWMSIDTVKDVEEIRREYANREDKPWGYEKIVINTKKYLTKELYIKEGYHTSYHYHEKKDETMSIMKGAGYIQYEKDKEYFKKGDNIRIKPKVPHSIVSLENTLLQEVSTPHPVDTVRIEDEYGR
jgi:NDP-sugar pyrophosphorylase family protein